jgi:hypothetical protein
VRYGCQFPDARSLCGALGPRREDLRHDLARVRGRIELGLRIVAASPARPASGRDYLHGRLDEEAQAGRAHDLLASLAVDTALAPPAAGRPLLTASYLVERDAAETFASEVERLRRELPAVELLCTGPWPPYSFVGAAA